MKIAATYDNGQIFQHFGHTEAFKVYDVDGDKIISSEIISSNGTGHGALAKLLSQYTVDVLICGGIGGGAQTALQEQGIELCAGASGDADEAVKAFLRGELINSGANCDHHHGEHSCGEHENGGCHGSCDTQSTISAKNAGKTCVTHYRGTFNDGTQNLAVGDQVYLQNMYGQPFPAKVTDKSDTSITFDANHEMAGKELNFHIELLEVR